MTSLGNGTYPYSDHSEEHAGPIREHSPKILGGVAALLAVGTVIAVIVVAGMATSFKMPGGARLPFAAPRAGHVRAGHRQLHPSRRPSRQLTAGRPGDRSHTSGHTVNHSGPPRPRPIPTEPGSHSPAPNPTAAPTPAPSSSAAPTPTPTPTPTPSKTCLVWLLGVCVKV